ncbi:MAG: response regulator transcription factor [Micromonosporaceae bacterium]
MTRHSADVHRILVVEDEPMIAESVAARLRAEGLAVTVAGDGRTALKAAADNPPDAVVLDLMLPGMDGLEVCRRLQADRPTPVLMLTARDDETDVLVGLGVGADDYLTKPFSMRELTARVQALLRRVSRAAELVEPGQPHRAAGDLRLGDIEVSQAQRRVRRAGTDVHLTPTEFDLLVHLASRPRVVHTRDQLLAEVWGFGDGAGGRTVDSHIKALRRKLRADLIRTVHGVGYALEPPPEAAP